jgi:hypothetical protein
MELVINPLGTDNALADPEKSSAGYPPLNPVAVVAGCFVPTACVAFLPLPDLSCHMLTPTSIVIVEPSAASSHKEVVVSAGVQSAIS